MLSNRILLMIVSILCMAVSAGAQDLKRELTQMRELLKGSDQLEVRMKVNVFENVSKKNLLYQDDVLVMRDKNRCLYKYAASEFLMNNDYMVRVDNEEKEILWAHRAKLDDQALNQQKKFDIDSMLMDYDNSSFIGNEAGVDHYRAIPGKGDMTQVDLYFKANTITKMTYLYTNGQLVAISFDAFNVRPQWIPTVFNESGYLSFRGSTAVGSGIFKGYRITNIDAEHRSK